MPVRHDAPRPQRPQHGTDCATLTQAMYAGGERVLMFAQYLVQAFALTEFITLVVRTYALRSYMTGNETLIHELTTQHWLALQYCHHALLLFPLAILFHALVLAAECRPWPPLMRHRLAVMEQLAALGTLCALCEAVPLLCDTLWYPLTGALHLWQYFAAYAYATNQEPPGFTTRPLVLEYVAKRREQQHLLRRYALTQQ